jgi:hypothetical protein
MIYKVLHRKLRIEQNEPHLNPRENSGVLIVARKRKILDKFEISATINEPNK